MVSLAESAAYEASSAVLEAWSAVMLASRLASCAAPARWRPPRPCRLEMEASLLASSEASAAAVTAPGERWPPWCPPPAA